MTMVFAFIFMLLVIAAMAIGVMFGRKPIAGSCGGLKNLGISGDCEICGGDPVRCESELDLSLPHDAAHSRLRD